MSAAIRLPGTIRDKLAGMARQQRELAAARGAGELLLFTSAAIGACLLADRAWNLSAGVRTGLVSGLAASVLLVLWFRVLRPVVRRRSWAELAAAVERTHPELTERLTTLVELGAEPDRAGSPLMHDLLAKQTVKAVANVDFTQALPAGKSLQSAALGMAAVALLLVPFLMPNGRYLLSWNRLFVPWGNYDWGGRLAFHVPDGDRVVARGSDVALIAELQGAAADEAAPLDAVLRWVDANGQAHQRPMTWNAEARTFAWTIPRVEQDFRFHVASRRAVSREYRVTAADRPRVAAWSIDVQPPAYTGLPAQALDAVVGELRVPEQSQLRFKYQFAEPVSSAALDWPEAAAEQAPTEEDDAATDVRVRQREVSLELADDRRSASIRVPATASGPFQIRLNSALGLGSEEPTYPAAIIPDQPPEIAARRDELPTVVRPDDVLPISLSARDDYGLSAVELHWQTSAGHEGLQAVAAAELAGSQLDSTLELNLSELNLLEGQTVTCRLRAVDNRPVPAPQETWSDSFTMTVSVETDALESRQLAAAQESLEERLEALEQAVALQKQAVDTEHRDAARQAVKSDQKPDNEDELEQLRRRQEELREQLESLRQELDRRPFLEKTAEAHVPQIEQKLADAQQALERAAKSDGARDQIEQLSKSLDDLARAEDLLAKLKQESQALAALEQELSELGRLAREAEKLAERAEKLEAAANPQATEKPESETGEKSPEGDAAQNKDELQTLQRETGELAEHLDDLLRRRPELLESARKNELDRLARLAEMAERLAEPQRQLAEAIAQESDPKSAPAAEQSDPANAPPADASPSQPGDQPAAAKPNAAASPAPSDSDGAPKPSDDSPTGDSPQGDAPERGQDNPEPGSNSPDGKPEDSPPARTDEQPANASEQELAAQVAAALRQQQQLAREAAGLQRTEEESRAAPQADAPAGDKNSTPNSTQAESLAQFAKQSRSAAQAAQSGDLKQAAQQCQGACQSANKASESGTPTGRKAGELAERQQALAEEFQRLSQSPAARQAAQQESQRQLNRTADSLAQALEQTASRMTQQPLDLPKSGQCASGACQSAKSAGESMKAASRALAQGDQPKAGKQAQMAGEQLRQAAAQAAEASGDKPASSPQSEKIPGETAGKVAEAASQLKQARQNLAQAEPSPGKSAEGQPSSPDGKPAEGETAPTDPSAAAPKPDSQGSKPGAASRQPDQTPGDANDPASRSEPGERPEPSRLERSADQLRQAALALSSACKACQSGSPGKSGKPGSQSKPGSQGQAAPAIAQHSGEPKPGEPSEPAEGFAEFGSGNTAPADEFGALPNVPGQAAAMRDWGRLPKHLQTEIRQGSAKKPHPEYTRQIKRYFEQIARPAEKRDRP